jgi:threonine/homoserine/homoserine lactone efflux protein
MRGVADHLAAFLGVSALLVASEPVFVALKIAGAAYLIFLGAEALLAALRPGQAGVVSNAAVESRRLAPAVAFRQGLISNLGNPKIGVFYTSFLPQFTPRGETSFAMLLLLGLSFSALGLLWLLVYAVAVAGAGNVLRRTAIRRAIEGVTGAVLIALGLRLATQHR